MATQAQIEEHYDIVGPLHALRMRDIQGEFPDYTCAFFDGDSSKTYAQAQEDKHTWIFDNLGLGQNLIGKKILDIGCGWGPLGNAVRKRGGSAVGLTLSSGQMKYCNARGLDVRLRDYKDIQSGELTGFHGVAAVGSAEAYCSPNEMLAGKQERIYRNFFRICADRLVPGGHLFVQTMTWGKKVPDYRTLSLSAPPDSTVAILARMEYLYPGSWLPNGLQQLIDCANDHFDFVTTNNGRLDYLLTLKCWDDATTNLWKVRNLPQTLRYGIPFMYHLMTSGDARIQFESIRRGDQRTCFTREIMSHERMFFVKKN